MTGLFAETEYSINLIHLIGFKTMDDLNGLTNTGHVERIESTPLTEREPATSTYEVLQRSASLWPNKCALSFCLSAEHPERVHQYSYAQLLENINRTANALANVTGDDAPITAYLLPLLPQTHFVIWGGEAAGIVAAINPMLDVEHIVAILEEAEANILVTQAPYPGTDTWEKVHEICERYRGLSAILAVDPAAFLPEKDYAAVSASRGDYLNDETLESLGVELLDFDSLIAGHNADSLDEPPDLERNRIAAYYHTGGSTGRPKLACHTHGMQVANAWVSRAGLGLTDRDVGLCGLPLFHVNAMMITGIAAFSVGAEIFIPSLHGYRDTALFKRFWELVETRKITFFSAVPTVYSTLLGCPVDGRDISSLRVGVCGGAPISVEIIKEFEGLTGITILEGYGLTECTCTATVNPLRGERRVGSIGIRLPYVQVKVGHTDNNGYFTTECTADEAGTLFFKGATVTPGYLDESKNEGLFTDGWINTGDLGRMDVDGYIWLTGRSKDLIIRGGHNIDPKQIDDALHKHPAVDLAAAVGRPDSRLGEVPMAYVSLREGQCASEKELLAFSAEHISERAAVPKQVVILDALPLTIVGKIYKPDLRRDAYRRVLETDLRSQCDNGAVTAIEVVEDKKHGNIARVILGEVDKRQRTEIQRIVARYPIEARYD